MKQCLQVTVSQVCSAVNGSFELLRLIDGVIFVEFNGMYSKVFVKKDYGTQ